MQDTCSVAIPEDGLNLAPYCTPGAVKQVSTPLYDLFGVVCHYGSLEVSHLLIAAPASGCEQAGSTPRQRGSTTNM